MFLYEVGKPYSPSRNRWPEVSQYRYRGGEHELILFFNHPKTSEVKGAESGKAEFGVLYEDGVVFLLYTIAGVCGWSDAPYNWWLESAEERTIPIPPEEHTDQSRALLTILLVGADDGILKVMRAISLPPSVTRALHGAIRDQASKPFAGKAQYEATIKNLYARYRDMREMVVKAVTGEGGV